MPNKDCVFCKVISKELPSTFIKETNDIIVIKDIAPKAPIHYLIIPKKHIPDIQSLDQADRDLVGNILMVAQQLSKNLSDSRAFRIVINSGSDAGQCVFHLHVHFLAGKKMEF